MRGISSPHAVLPRCPTGVVRDAPGGRGEPWVRLGPGAGHGPDDDPLISLAALAPAGLQVEPDATAVAEQVADTLLEALRRGSTLGLATGRTMVPVYGALRRRLAASATAFGRRGCWPLPVGRWCWTGGLFGVRNDRNPQ